MLLHEQQLHVCQMLQNLLEAANEHSFYHGFCDYASIRSAAQMAKACGFYVAIAKDFYTGDFAAVCVWETEYDTRMTKVCRGFDVFTRELRTKEEQAARPRTWVFATHPQGTHGSLTAEVGAPSQGLAYAGYRREGA